MLWYSSALNPYNWIWKKRDNIFLNLWQLFLAEIIFLAHDTSRDWNLKKHTHADMHLIGVNETYKLAANYMAGACKGAIPN